MIRTDRLPILSLVLKMRLCPFSAGSLNALTGHCCHFIDVLMLNVMGHTAVSTTMKYHNGGGTVSQSEKGSWTAERSRSLLCSSWFWNRDVSCDQEPVCGKEPREW